MKIDKNSEMPGVLSANQRMLQNLDNSKGSVLTGLSHASGFPGHKADKLKYGAGLPGGDAGIIRGSAETGMASGMVFGADGMLNDLAGGSQTGGPQGISDLDSMLGADDVQIKQDYMSVMSLSMSDEDYAEMARTGRPPEDMDAADSVTILDDIKAALIRGGADIQGYTDNIDPETLTAITGSEVAAGALLDAMHAADAPVNETNVREIVKAADMAKDSLPLSEDAKAFLLSERQAPTIENIYRASHAGGRSASYTDSHNTAYTDGQTSSRTGEADGDFEELRPQIEDIIRRSGLEVNEDTVNDARWLLDRNLPLTPGTLLELENLQELYSPIESAAFAIGAGIPAEKANLAYDGSVYTLAEELADTVINMPDEAADMVADKGQLLNIRNLRAAAAELASAPAPQETVTDTLIPEDAAPDALAAGRVSEELSPDALSHRRILEEARLSMTVESARILTRLNVNVEIAPLEEVVDALKKAENMLAGRLFPGDSEDVAGKKAEEYRDVKEAVRDIYGAPAAILGTYRSASVLRFGADEVFTLNEVRTAGIAARDGYIRAGETYEALMTAPRADMGDSIRKAFANVDDILSGLDLEVDELSRRAVRILGYNSMEITVAAVEQVREADINLRSVLNRLTPDRVLNMIREDVNPLNMPISELGEYLDSQDQEPERKAQDYAKFLMQLERREEITELERDSYIGIYRMISRLDNTEDAALGKLLAMGSEISFQTLLSAMRSTAKGHMDYSVGDDFGGVDSSMSGKAIDAQINSAFSDIPDTRITDTVIENLLMSGNEASLSNAEAYSALRSARGTWYKDLRDSRGGARTASVDSIKDTVDNDGAEEDFPDPISSLLEKMNDRESAVSAYTDMLDRAGRELSEAILGSDDLIDIRRMQISMKQINILSGLAPSETYDLPVEFDGSMTSIRLTLRHETGAGRVAISLTTVTVGTIAAEFGYSGSPSGYIAYETDEAGERLGSRLGELEEALGFAPELVKSAHIQLERFEGISDVKKETEASDINSTELYHIAKGFISILKNI